MKNDLQGMTLPTCDIMVNGQKRKLYGKKKNQVYLHNGDNFQLNCSIHFKNALASNCV